MARPRYRSIASEFKLFSTNTTLGWSSTHRISFAQGERGVMQGRLRRVMDGWTGKHEGYQPVVAAPIAVPSQEVSRCSLAEPEMKANAGLFGRSRTVPMTPDQRASRIHPKSGSLMPEMDFVEHARELVKLYPHSANYHDMKKRGISDRAVRVYPKVPPVWKPKAKIRMEEGIPC